MIAVIAENFLKDGQEQEFLDLSTHIRPSIEAIDGFLSVERFESLSQPGKILSLSFWRDEQALRALWQNEPHREDQWQADCSNRPRTGYFRQLHPKWRKELAEHGGFRVSRKSDARLRWWKNIAASNGNWRERETIRVWHALTGAPCSPTPAIALRTYRRCGHLRRLVTRRHVHCLWWR